MAFVLMKIFEEAPRRFDRWMNILTLGRLQQVRDQIAKELVHPGATVLEIGCGTGSLLQMMARRGAHVTGIDCAPGMIEEAQRNITEAGLAGLAEVKKLHALQIEDTFRLGTFDQIVSVMAFSEMSDDEIDCLLVQCRKILKAAGELILADESEPAGAFPRLIYRIYRHFSRFMTYLGLQAREIKKGNIFLKLLYFAIELPLMILAFLVAPPLTHPLRNMGHRFERAGFQIGKTRGLSRGNSKTGMHFGFVRQAGGRASRTRDPRPRCVPRSESHGPRAGRYLALPEKISPGRHPAVRLPIDTLSHTSKIDPNWQSGIEVSGPSHE